MFRILAASLFLLVPPVRAQSVLHTFYGDDKKDYFGGAVSGAGDVNGDGYADVIAGARFDRNSWLYSGSTQVFDPSTADTGAGGPPVVDMGVYER